MTMTPSRIPFEDPKETLAGMRRIRLAIAGESGLDIYRAFSDLKKPGMCTVNAIGALIRKLDYPIFVHCLDILTKRCPGDRRRLNNSVMLSCRFSLRDSDMRFIRDAMADHFHVPGWVIDQVDTINNGLTYVASPDSKFTSKQRVLSFLEKYDANIQLYRKRINAKT